ncbi:M14 family zinc carboxypeptidase [Vagococcus lutrae]|uniref:M14 family zinc carboxypeptidase n=1 Tax=Vagococcus lutrae TaxID=81947 RepID=UPI00288E725A|nr:M14 family zinc carboxypeptidase [Vagococcus lutrae]MDT2808392.1 DUF2817 domain-containing protein [Vagococcus lutrae]
MLKDFQVDLELSPRDNRVIQTGATYWSHDVNTAKINIKLLRHSEPVVLNKDVTVRVMMLFDDENKSEHIYTAKIEDELKGLVSITLEESMRMYVGQVTCGVYVDYQNEEKTDNGYFTFGMRRSLIDKDMPELQKLYVSDFEKALEKFKEIEKKIEQNDVVTHPELKEYTYAKKYIDENIKELSNLKANKDEVLSKKETNKALDSKADKQKTETVLNELERKKADQSFVDAQLSSIVSGAPKGTYKTLQALKEAYPDGTEGVFLVLENGHWYYYADGWQDGGVYQSQGIQDKSVTPIKTTFIEPAKNLINFDEVIENKTINSIGEPHEDNWSCLSGFIKVEQETEYSHFNVTQFARYDSDKKYLSVATGSPTNSRNAHYVRVVMNKKDYKRTQLNKGETLTEYDDGKDKLKDNVSVSKGNISDFSIYNEDIKDNEIHAKKIKPLGSSIELIFSDELINIDTTKRTVYIPKNIIFVKGEEAFQKLDSFETVMSAHHNYFYINFKTREIKLETSIFSADKLDKNFSLFMIISFKSAASNELSSVYIKGDYKVDGKLASRVINNTEDIDIEKKHFSEVIPQKLYTPVADIKDFSAESHYKDDVKMSDILTNLDNAVRDFPEWASKKELGLDSTNTHKIYQYEFKPQQVPSWKYNKKFPKILIVAGTHGEEKLSAMSVSQYINDLTYNYNKDKTLEFVRYNVHLIIIPFLNVWGFHNRTRKNGNGVDLNRNSSFRWETSNSTDPNSPEFKGEAPFSEKESQYVRDLILQNKDAIAFFDYHMNGTSGEPGDYLHNFWHQLDDFPSKSFFNGVNELAKRNIMMMTRINQEKYKAPKDSGWCGLISYNSTQSTLSTFANSEGVAALTLECLRKLQHEDVVYSKDALAISTEYLGNNLINTCFSLMD